MTAQSIPITFVQTSKIQNPPGKDGDAKHMAKDAARALREAIAAHGSPTADAADVYVADLKKTGRYARDVY